MLESKCNKGVPSTRLFPGWLPMMPKIILSQDNMVWWIIVMDHQNQLLLQEQVAWIINHILGPNYAIQGNILLGQQILDSMEYYFLNTSGCLPERLMAAMNGAKVVGADTRCMVEGTSSLSAFKNGSTDSYNNLFLDINVAEQLQM